MCDLIAICSLERNTAGLEEKHSSVVAFFTNLTASSIYYLQLPSSIQCPTCVQCEELRRRQLVSIWLRCVIHPCPPSVFLSKKNCSLLIVSWKVVCGIPLLLLPWEGSKRMSSLAVDSWCRTPCQSSLIRLGFILSEKSAEIVIQCHLAAPCLWVGSCDFHY